MNFPNTVLDPNMQAQGAARVYTPFTESQVQTSQSALQGIPQGKSVPTPVTPYQATPSTSPAVTPVTQQSILYKNPGDIKPVTEMKSESTAGKIPDVSYADFLETLKADTTGKYIGAIPKSGEGPAIQSTQAYSPDTQVPSGQAGGQGWQTALTAAQQTIGAISANQQTLVRNEYNTDVAKWQENGKYWFDKNANLKPDLQKYMESMPSSVESLKEGSWVTSLQDGSTDTAGEYASSVLLNPAGFKTGNDTVSAILNPLNILEQNGWVDEGQVNYIGGKASEGAMSGGFVGAAIGIIDGIFSWNSSKAEDKKRKAEAQAEYELKLKEWTFARNKRLLDAQTARSKEIADKKAAYANKREVDTKTDNRQKIADITTSRQSMIEAMLGAGTTAAANRNERLKRWS